jgi:anthranilate synthase component 1
LVSLLRGPANTGFGFQLNGSESALTSADEFLEMVQKGKAACQAGEVFQIVLSRRFSQGFTGDDFQVYRALRTINPSPYLYYFDYGDFRLLGSSPEAQVVSDGKRAEIHPIAGTFQRTGNDQEDAASAARLAEDPKENAEHVMLVDLARNDLARTGQQVKVDRFREIQYFSHVIHLVSRVVAELAPGTNPVALLGNSVPAGTLSGAPKHRALSLIDQWESHHRGFYGGAIGMYGLDGQVNHAIIIRSFLSQAHRLYFQAGAGIVNGSVPELELAEVTHKLAALRRAIQKATLL